MRTIEKQQRGISSVNKHTVVVPQTDEVQRRGERRQLLWDFLISSGMIAGVVTVATLVAHWMRTIR